MNADAYAGDVDSREAWAILESDPKARLVDVRTEAEWAYVGVPDPSPLGKDLYRISWQRFPDMRVNAEFAEDVVEAGIGRADTVLLICRSGARSRDAAIALTGRGFKRALNVADGFEGPLDQGRHRGTLAGWKAAGLPWRQF